ncbi:MAG: Nitrous oxide reductase accessory protein NosD [Candidatus Alkanophagales archaeon MCA70_species_2]|nr:Nitrous oxide reductase accessory protein NosD [Candidatus Alkanophaga liquidiphilum]
MGWGSSDNVITGNTVSDNGRGIYLEDSNNNSITGNTISNNDWEGIRLWYTSNNVIYLNNFINNADSVYSYDSTNIWNSTSQMTYTYEGGTYTNYLGNYWSDYTGSDADGDGIGDTPYSIDGDKNYYPLMEPFENYRLVPTPTPTPTPVPEFTSVALVVAALAAILLVLRRLTS